MTRPSLIDANFDSLVGPTHHYGGLAQGDLASEKNKGQAASPKLAALQGLKKMKTLMDKGLVQGVLPPHSRPDFSIFPSMGFAEENEDLIRCLAREDGYLLSAAYSSSFMWAANAATVTPSYDSKDGKCHFTPANLSQNFHRAFEAKHTSHLLKSIFSDPEQFVHHEPLPSISPLSDEGAANHTRLEDKHGNGFHIFVYGKKEHGPLPKRYPARQSLLASQSIARRHGLDPSRCFFIQQNPDVIDAGVFHNDVISVGQANVFFYHEDAFVDSEEQMHKLNKTIEGLELICIERRMLSVEDCVSTYLFNSQLLRLANGKILLFCPSECEESEEVRQVLEKIVEMPKVPIDFVEYIDVKQSMRNGGGPACLRLRVPLTPEQVQTIPPKYLLTAERYSLLCRFVETTYPEHVDFKTFLDPSFADEARAIHSKLLKLF